MFNAHRSRRRLLIKNELSSSRRWIQLETLESRCLLAGLASPISYVPGEILIGLEGKLPALYESVGEKMAMQSAAVQLNSLGLTAGNVLMDLKTKDAQPGQLITRWQIPQGSDINKVVEAVAKLPGVAYAEPNYILTAATIPNDPSFGSLWGLNNTGQSAGTADADIDAVEAWADFGTGSSSIVVGVIDTGVDYLHPDLQPNMWANPNEIPGNGIDDDGNNYIDDVHGINAITGSGNPMDDNNHGTHVAGTIGARGNNGIGVAGVNWNVQIAACKFLSATGSGSTSDAVECFQYFNNLKANGVNVVITNNSWGGGGFSQSLMNAMSGNILHATAAGNSNNNNDATASYPAGYDLPNIISVAATDRNDRYASFSSYGQTTVDLAAPGVSILSTTRNNTYASFNGTSMATPHVAGAAALISANFPALTAVELKAALMNGTDSIATIGTNSSKPTVTNGRLNLNQSLVNLAGTLLVQLSPVSGTTTAEAGGTASFSVKLGKQPTADVIIPLSSSDPSEGLVSTSSLTFTPSNWDSPQTVTVTGQDDAEVDGDVAYQILLGLAVSDDSLFNGFDPADVSLTNLDDDQLPPTSDQFYFSLQLDQAIGGVATANEDILALDENNVVRIVFDGSNVGVGGLTLSAFDRLSTNDFLLSFSEAGSIPGVGTVDDSDVVLFTATSLGENNTAGTFSLYIDGSDVGLSANSEDIDALHQFADGSLLISTIGSHSVPGLAGDDKDLLKFVPSSLGSSTQGAWSLYFDGTDVGLGSNSEDIDAVSIDADGSLYLSTAGNFAVTGRSGADEDVFVFTPTSLGPNTSGSFSSVLFFDGSLLGLDGNDLTSFDLPQTSASSATDQGFDSQSNFASSAAPLPDLPMPGNLSSRLQQSGELAWVVEELNDGPQLVLAAKALSASALQSPQVSPTPVKQMRLNPSAVDQVFDSTLELLSEQPRLPNNSR
jgi:subtilisin family serine protease